MLKKKSNQGKTNSAVVLTTTVLFVLMPALVIWLTIGEVDLFNLDWLVSHGGALWKGSVHNNQELIDWIVKNYNPKNLPTIDDYYVYIMNEDGILINNYIYLFSFLPLVCGIIFPIMLIVMGKGQIDIYPFTISIGMGSFIFIMCGLLPIQTNGLKWALSLLISLVPTLGVFLFINKLVNTILSTTKVGVRMAIDLQTDKRILNKYEKDLKDLVNSETSKDNIEYIETGK